MYDSVSSEDNPILLTANQISGNSANREAEKLTNDNIVAMSSQRSAPWYFFIKMIKLALKFENIDKIWLFLYIFNHISLI